ncbi:MAG TPA: FadR/GntR family transcriptional regulator [Polyangia bacterium]|nr:FadR/GntR family transcriptional regulator [Polyangia bacterium]
MLQRVEKQRIAEEIVEQLRSLILQGTYTPGDKLPPERKLAEQLGVNRASLREAIKKLEHMGLVKTRQGDGTRVLDWMQTAGLELVRHLVERGSPDILHDVLEFRTIYGREVARLSAQRASPQDLARLDALAEQASKDVAPEELLRLDLEFYVALAEAARNQVFKLLINTIRGAVSAYGKFFAQFQISPAEVRKHQKALLKALRDRDPDAAVRAAESYLMRAEQLLASFSRT